MATAAGGSVGELSERVGERECVGGREKERERFKDGKRQGVSAGLHLSFKSVVISNTNTF